MQPDDVAVSLLRRGDRRALAVIYDHYGQALFGVVRNIVGDDTIAEDALQEILVKIWLQAHTFDRGKGTLFTWMLNVARNHALDTIRSRQFRHREREVTFGSTVEIAERYDDAPDDTPVPYDVDVDAGMLVLPREQRTVVDMVYYQGYTLAEIASMTDTPLGTVKSRLRLALTRLRSHFAAGRVA